MLPDGLSDAARKIAETMLSNPRISARPQPASLPRRCRLLDLAPSHGTQFPTEVSIHSLGEAALMPLHLVGPARRAGRRLTGNDAFQAAHADSRGGGRACRGQNGGARRPAEPPGWAVVPRPPPPPTNHIFALPSCATAIDLVFYPPAMALCQSHRQAGRPPLMARSDPRHYFYSGE